jgi:TonB-linked SusC/RagA family outer membrane protein
MFKILLKLSLPLFFLTPIIAKAQQVTVTGKIINEKDGKPIESASIIIRGKETGSKADANGNFSITATKGDALIISAINFRTQTIKVKDPTPITIGLMTSDGLLSDVVVVAAMDIKRNSRELGYSAPKVSGEEIQQTQRENFLNALGGRVAGLSITPTGGQAGASTNIVLRGFNSLALSNQPLFVIDGAIVDNQSIDENSNSGSGLGLASDRPNRNNDYTNRIGDINPNDIETITVLKGPEAAALYGSQASSGAIIITTKKAKLLTSPEFKFGAINYDNSFRISKLTRTPEINTDYGMGTNGNSDSSFNYFGPALTVPLKTYDNIKDFFQIGFAQTHNLSADVGNKFTSFKISGSYFNQSSVVPNNKYTRYTLRVANTTWYKKLIEITPAFTYTNSKNYKPLRGAGGYLLNLLRWPVTESINNQYNPDSTKREIFATGAANEEIDNPLWNVNNNKSEDGLNKQNSTLGINIYPTSWLTLNGRFGYETYKNDGWTFYHPEANAGGYSFAQRGFQDNYYRKYTGYNHTITATAKRSYKKFNGRLMVGTMWQDYKTQAWSVSGSGIADPITFKFDPKMIGDSNATTPATRTRLYRNNVFHDFNYKQIRQLAYFGELALNWNNIFFINYTHRFEEGSTLPKINRKVNYPAGSVSLIFSDLIKSLQHSNFLTYGKIRASLANTAKSNSPYSNQSVFNLQTSSGGGYAYDFTNNNFFLEPEKQTTYETGLELRLFKNKISIDATYYDTKNRDQILELLRTSYGTGFVLNTLNLSSTRNQGVEIAINTKLINNKDFIWNAGLNFNRSWNELLTLPSNLPEFYIADTWLYGSARAGLRRGSPTTGITSAGYARNKKGIILVDPATGFPVIDNNFLVRGDRNPSFTTGITNTLRYKNWSLNMLWDVKVGGDVFNGNGLYLAQIGRHPLTADREKPLIFNGILKDGLEDSPNPTINNIVVTPYLNQGFYTSALNEEYFIEKDVNWLRLRDITVSYDFKDIIKNFKYFKNLSAFITGTNLILLTNYTGADPAVNGTTPGTRGVGAFGFDYGTLPETIGLNIGFRAGF